MFELTLWLLSCGWAVAAQDPSPTSPRDRRTPTSPGGAPGRPPPASASDLDQKVLEAIREFPPYAVHQIEDAKAATAAPSISSWKDLIAYTPFLTEMVAMWYTLQDPEVPNKVKLEVAAALLYAISPYDADWFPVAGWTDDAAFLAYAFWDVYEYISPAHIEQAKAWLLAHGVDPKPIFALHKEFVDRDIHPAIEDAVEVHPGEKMGALPGPINPGQVKILAAEIVNLVDSARRGQTTVDPLPKLYQRMQVLGRMVGYTDFPGRHSTSLDRIRSVASSAYEAASDVETQGSFSKVVGLKQYLLTNLMSQLAMLAGAVAFGAYGAEDSPALDVAKKFSAEAMHVFSDSDEHVFGPFSAISIGWSRPELSPTAYVVVVTDVNSSIVDGLKAAVRSVAYASVVVRAARTQKPGQWVFTFDSVQG